MRKEIQKGLEDCKFGLYSECKGTDCFAFITFTDQEKGLCAFDVGRAATRMIPQTVKTLAEILKKAISLFVILGFLCFPALSEETWAENKKYIDLKFSNIETGQNEIKTQIGTLKKELTDYTDKHIEEKTKSICDDIASMNKTLNLHAKILWTLVGAFTASGLIGGGKIANTARKKRATLKSVIETIQK